MKKWLFYLFVWYVAGSITSALLTDKKWDEFKKEVTDACEKWEDLTKILYTHFMNIQKKLVQDLKAAFLTEERKAKMGEKKVEIQKMVDDYKVEGEKMIRELQGKGKIYASQISDKLESFYNVKKEEGKEQLKWLWENAVHEFNEKFHTALEKLKSKIKQ